MHAELKHRATLAHAPEVAHPRFENVRIGNDDLFAGEAAQTRALDADVLDRPLKIVDAEKVANDKRLIQGNGHRGQQVAEH